MRIYSQGQRRRRWFYSVGCSVCPFQMPSGQPKQDESGLYYVVDDGHNRLLCFDGESNIRYALVSPSDGRGVLYIDDFAVDGGLVYLSASEWDGMLLSREVIAVFKGDRFVRTITERDYSGMTVNKHRFHGVTVQDGVLSFIECEDNMIVAHWITLEDGEERARRIYFDNAFNALSDCVFSRDSFYVLEKSGNITAFENSRRLLVYSTRRKGEESRVPFRMALASDGSVCFTDIRAGEAVKVDSTLRRAVPISGEIISQTIHFTQDGTSAMYLEEDGLRVVSDTRTTTYLTLQKPVWRIAFQWAWFTAVIVCGLLLAVLFVRGAIAFMTRKYDTPQLISFWVIGSVAAVSALLCGILIGNFSDIYRNQITARMESSARIVANQIPAGTISQIVCAEDFNGDAFFRWIWISTVSSTAISCACRKTAGAALPWRILTSPSEPTFRWTKRKRKAFGKCTNLRRMLQPYGVIIRLTFPVPISASRFPSMKTGLSAALYLSEWTHTSFGI